MEKLIKFFVINISLFLVSFFFLIIILKYYLNINIISFGFLSFGFKYVSKKINPLLESIKIDSIKLQYKRVKYSKSKVLILSIAGIHLKVSPTFVSSISKKEESKFLRKLSKKIIDGIYNYNLQNEYKKNFEEDTNDKNELSSIPTIKISPCNNDNKTDNSRLKNSRKYSNSSYLSTRKTDLNSSIDNIRKSKKENLNISSTTLYSSKQKKNISLFQTLLYTLDNKYIFEIIIPSILSKIAVNISDINVEVKFPEGSKVEYKQEYISFSSAKKELRSESINKYFDYILFKQYNPYNYKIRFLFSEFYLKFYEVDHSYSSYEQNEINNKNTTIDSEEDSIQNEYNYKEYDILRSDEKNSIIISSIFNCISTKTNCNFSFKDIKCDSDGWINLIRLYTILKKIFENYFDMSADKKHDSKNSKKKSDNNKEKNVINKYRDIISSNKNIKYIKAKIMNNNTLKKHSYLNSFKSKNLHKKYSSEQNCYTRSIADSNSSLKSDISSNEFDNSNLNGFMNNEIIQIFFFYLKSTKINYNFQILNFQLTSVSHFCGYRHPSKTSLTPTGVDEMYVYNQNPQFLNVITIGEISFKGEAYKSKSKLYNIVTSISLKNLYLDIIDYNVNYTIQFFNIKSIYTKLEGIFQFYKFKQHLSYMKNINFDFNISTINLNFDFDYSYGLYQHLNYIIKKLDNKYQFNHNDDPLFNINKLIVVSRATSLQDLSNKDNNKISSNYSINNINNYKSKPKNKNSLNDILTLVSKYNKKFSKLKININFGIKNIILNYIILSEKIQNYYSINNSLKSLPDECILIQFGIRNVGLEYSNSKKIKLQSILSSSTVSMNSDKKFDSETKINGSFTAEDYDKYILYEEQLGLHEIEFEINDITLTGSFVHKNKIINKSTIRIDELVDYEKNHGISLDKFTTKVVFSILNIEKDSVNVKKDDKFLIGTSLGNLKFNFGSSKLSSNTLIVIIDLVRLKLHQLSKQLPIQKKNDKYSSNVSLSTESCDSSYTRLDDLSSNLQLKRNNIYYSTPELYSNNNLTRTVEPLQNEVLSAASVNTNSSSNIGESYDDLNINRKQTVNFFSYYMFIFDFKINTISFSILNPEDECGFQFDIKKILFHYNNNCYITHNTTNNRKLIIKPNDKVKNQFSFNIKEVDLYYLDTLKYLKKGIVMHNFLKINDILINLVDVSAPSNLSSINDLSSISSISNTESLESVTRMKFDDSTNFNKINFNIKKIRIYISIDVFFSLLSTANSILIKIVKPFVNTMEKSMSQSISDVAYDSNVSDSNLNCSMNNKLKMANSTNSVRSSSKNNILNNIKLNVENIQLELDMPDNIKLFIYLKDNIIGYANAIKYDVSKILVLLPSQMNKKSNLLKIKNLCVTYNLNNDGITNIYSNAMEKKNTVEMPPDLNVFGDIVVISIPYLFDLSDVIDSIIHMMKAMKNIFYKVILNKEYVSTPTIIEVDEMIKALICFNMVSLQFIENEFESNLSKIFLYGSKEQKERVAREIAFEKKINDLRNIKNQEIKAGIQKGNPTTNNNTNNTTEINKTVDQSNSNNENNTTSNSNENINNNKVGTTNNEEIVTNENNTNENNNAEINNNSENVTSDINAGNAVEANANTLNTTTDNATTVNNNNPNNTNVTSTQSTNANSTVNPIHNTEEENALIEAKILKASQLLKKMNSSQWINIVKQYKNNTPSTKSSLMGSISLYNVKALVDKPKLLGKTSEETIHIIDENTPADKIYDTLVPIKLTLKIGSGTMELRDYPERMLDIPESDDDSNRPSVIFNISVFITEQDPNEECKKWVNVKYFHNKRMETILRTINPTKMYFYGAKLIVQTNQRAGFTWGYSNDPVFTHILQTISAFSKDCYDPSDKLPWWDKMRLNFHGSLDVVVTQGCEFDVHLLGSCSPYYTIDSDYFGNDGINIIFGKGVNIKLGNTGIKNEVLRICCGEVKCIIPRMRREQYYENYNFNSHNLIDIINNETVINMSGDVNLSIICTFDPIVDNYFTKTRNHDEIYLKLPQYATPYPNTTVFDSFSGFRTKNIHMDINLSSPSYNFSGLNYQHNYIHLSLDAINYIINFTEFMSMGVLGLPVGVGPLFNKKVDKKIPMDISELNIKLNLMPLMIGISSYINDDCYPNEFMIGIRCKAQTFNMELSMVYKDEESKELEFTYSNAIVTSVHGKAYTLGNATTEEAKLYSFKGDELNVDDDDIYCWRNDLDKFYIHNNIPINTKFLFYSAYVSYFKRNAIGDSEKLIKEYQIIENDISRVQIDLIQKRYFEIEILIRKLVEQQNNMDSYTNKFEQSVDIVDLLAILYEKKKILKEQMEKEESSFYFNNKSIDNSTEMDTGLFNNIFIVHNIQLVWNQAVRNVIFKLVNLNSRINLLHNNMTYKLDKEMMKITNFKHSNHNSYESLDEKVINTPITLDEQKKRDSCFNIITNNNNGSSEKLDIDNNSNIADELLKKLISEQNTHFVVTEHDNNSTEDEDTIEFPEIQSKSDTYISSRNESSPDYISPYEKAINSTLINFINPEVCFEVGVDYIEKDKELGLILLVAKSAQYRSISITDLDVEDCNNVKDEEIIKQRSHVAIQDAQLNTAHRSKRNKFPLTLVLNTSDGKLQWPLWVPLECIFDPSSHCGIMEHVADSFNGNWLSDSYNASYVKPLERLANNKNNKKKNSSDDKPDGVNSTTAESEDKKAGNGTLKLKTKMVCVDNDNEIDTNIIAIKECNLCATSLQYCTIYSVICDLFSYTEPEVLKIEDSVQKLVFRIEQLDDLNAILENIYILKSNIRTLKQSIVQLEWNEIFHNELENLSILDCRSKYKQLQNHLYQTQDDLLYLVLALKKINKQRNSTKKNSSKIKSKFIYMSKDLTYNMLLDNSTPYCECIFKDLKFQIDTLDDKTNINTVELRKIIVHNLLEKDNVYKKALGPYLPYQRELLENTKEKMFRLYYRENPAIGGIPIIDHFEINLIPILVQITNKLVNHLLWYIFPDKYKHSTSLINLYDDIDQEKLDCSDVDSIIYYSYQQKLKAEEDTSEQKNKKKPSKSNAVENENDLASSDNEINKNGSANISDDEMKEYKFNDSDDDILSDHEGSLKDKNKKLGSTNALSTLANSGTTNGKGDNKIEYNVNQMQNRASQNKTFVYIKIPGAHHCISYKGPKDKNIYDIFQFTFKFPTLEYRNKTWSWYEFLMAVKKDLTKTVLNHVASLMKEKIFKRKLNEKESNKMFGMLDEQIMHKFKKYYKNRSSASSNASNYSMITSSTMSTINSNAIESNFDDINYIPEGNEEELDLEYVHELQKELYNEQLGHDSDGNMNHNMSKESLIEGPNNSSSTTPTPTSNNNTTKSNKTKNDETNSTNKSIKTLPREHSMDLLDTNFPVPLREGNTRGNDIGNNGNNIITNSMQSISTYSSSLNDYNEYMFIKRRMLFGKYMDDKQN